MDNMDHMDKRDRGDRLEFVYAVDIGVFDVSYG